jgi:hypothetical protein
MVVGQYEGVPVGRNPCGAGTKRRIGGQIASQSTSPGRKIGRRAGWAINMPVKIARLGRNLAPQPRRHEFRIRCFGHREADLEFHRALGHRALVAGQAVAQGVDR